MDPLIKRQRLPQHFCQSFQLKPQQRPAETRGSWKEEFAVARAQRRLPRRSILQRAGVDAGHLRWSRMPVVATENRIRAGADAAMGYPRFAMLDLLKLLSGLLVGLFRSHAAREAETAFLRQQPPAACGPEAVGAIEAQAAPCRSPDLRLALSAVPFRARSRGCLQA